MLIQISIDLVPNDIIDTKLVQVMAWCRQPTSSYLIQYNLISSLATLFVYNVYRLKVMGIKNGQFNVIVRP